MDFYWNLFLLVALSLSTTEALQDFYYTSNGGNANMCPIQICQTCATAGQYKVNCGDKNRTDPGQCVNCTGLPSGGVWVTHGWFNNTCEFNCSTGYLKNNSQCYVLMSQVKFASVMQVPVASAVEPFNRTAFILAVAKASKCATCTSLYTDPAVCGFCKIFVNNVTLKTTARRLLAASYIVDWNIDITMPSTEATTSPVTTNPTNFANQLATSISTEMKTEPVTVTSTKVTVTETAPLLPSQLLTTPPPPVFTTTTTAQAIPATTTKQPTTQPATTTTKQPTTTTLQPTTSTIKPTTTSIAPTTSSTTQPPATTSTAKAPTTTTAASPGTPPPQTTSKPSEESSNIGMIVGAAAGGGALLLLIIIVAVVFTINSSTQNTPPVAKPAAASAEGKLFFVNTKGDPVIRLHVDHPLYRL